MGSSSSSQKSKVAVTSNVQTQTEPIRSQLTVPGQDITGSQLTISSGLQEEFSAEESYGHKMSWFGIAEGKMNPNVPPKATFYRHSDRRFVPEESIGHFSRENSRLGAELMFGNINPDAAYVKENAEGTSEHDATGNNEENIDTKSEKGRDVKPLPTNPIIIVDEAKSTTNDTISRRSLTSAGESTVTLPSDVCETPVAFVDENLPQKQAEEVMEENLVKVKLENAQDVFIDNPVFDVAIGYLESVQNANRKKGNYKEFPTTEILQVAQWSLLRLKVIPPQDVNGSPLPFPHVLPLNTEMDVSLIDETTSLIRLRLQKSEGLSISEIAGFIGEKYEDVKTYLLCVYFFIQRCDLSHLRKLLYNYDDIEESKLRAIVFTKFCNAMNVRSAVISGQHKRGIHDIRNNKLAHWSAVLLNGHWNFVDASAVEFEDLKLWRNKGAIIQDAFFLVDPVCFIHTHFPTKPYWQQICRLVNKREWSDMVYLHPNYFRYGFQFRSHNRYIIKCEIEPTTILLKYSEHNKLMFHAEIISAEGPIILPDFQSATIVKTRSMSDTMSEVIVKFVAPHSGNFTLAIFGLDISTNPYHRVHLCSYRLYSSVMDKDLSRLTFYPVSPLGRFQWGPGADTIQAGYRVASHANGFIISSEQYIIIKFAIATPKKREIAFKFLGGTALNVDFNKCVFQWTTSGILHFIVFSPGEGVYAFHICHVLNQTLDCFCSYLITFKSTAANIKVPNSIHQNRLGVTKSALSANFDHSGWIPSFTKVSDTGELTVCSKTENCKMSICRVELQLLGQQNTDMTGYTTTSHFDNLLMCSMVFPRVGIYLLSLYVDDGSGNKTCWHRGLLVAETPSAKWTPYPIKNLDLKEDFRLNTPLSGLLPAKAEVLFAVEILNAHDIAVVTSSGWIHLTQTEVDNKTWEGLVNTGVKGTEMKLCARFEVGSDTFTPLCIFKVISAEDMNSRTSRQLALRNIAEDVQRGDFELGSQPMTEYAESNGNHHVEEEQEND